MKKKISYLCTFLIGFIITNNVLAAGFDVGTGKVCGVSDMPKTIPVFTKNLYTIVMILVPIILIIMGMIDFMKAVMASDEDKMKKSQKTFITRIIAAVIIFLILTVVKFVFKALDKNNSNGFVNCINCIISNKNCGNSENENGQEKKTCEQYSGSECPKGTNETDDYGHRCKQYYDAGLKCRKYGTECSDFSKSECDTATTTSGASCEYVGLKCRSKCSGLGIGSCSEERSHCDWINGTCVDKITSSGGNNVQPTTPTTSSTTPSSTTPIGTSQSQGQNTAKQYCSNCRKIQSSNDQQICLANCIEDAGKQKCSDCKKIPSSAAQQACLANCV